MPTRTALILGVDTAAGAYLARLLAMRGYRLFGSGADFNLIKLGIAADVVRGDDVAALLADARADEVYDLRGDATATAALLDARASARVFVAVDGIAALPRSVLQARDAGRFVVVGRMFPNESRLGPGTSFVARVVAAAAVGADPAPDDLTAVADCGWTPEYVDAMWRMLQRAAPADFTIATGHAIGGNDVARHAFAYFGRDVARFTGATPADAPLGDPGATRADLGWSATTWGRDLVRTLCEGWAP